MQSIIEELYYGNIRPNSKRYGKDSPFMEAVQLRERNKTRLLELLNETEKEIFEKYCDAHGDIEDITRYDTFSYALKFGILLMVEIFTGQDTGE